MKTSILSLFMLIIAATGAYAAPSSAELTLYCAESAGATAAGKAIATPQTCVYGP